VLIINAHSEMIDLYNYINGHLHGAVKVPLIIFLTISHKKVFWNAQ